MSKKYTTQQRKIQAHEIHQNKYDYSLWKDNVKILDIVNIICPIHGIFKQKLNTHINLKSGCPKCGIEKAKQTNLKRYGVEHPLQNDDVKEKAKQTNLKRYDVENPSQLNEIKEKKKETCLKNHGVEHPLQNDDVKEKAKQTNLKRYGVEHPLQNDDIKEKAKQTLENNYGVTIPFHSYSIQNKAKQTNLKKYGVEHPLQNDDVKEKTKQTNLKRYGVEHPLQNDEIYNKFLSSMLEIHSVEHPLQNDEIYNKFKQTNLEKYGVEFPSVLKHIKEKIKKTNLEKYGVEHPSQKDIDLISLSKLNDKEWMFNEHIIQQKSLQQISKELNVSDATVGKYLHLHGYETQCFLSSQQEKDLQKFIQQKSQSLTKNNDRNIISPYELDIVIPEQNIAIEYCGLFWHSEQAGKNKHYHKKKLDLCHNQGIQLITIFEDEWIYRQKQVKSKLLSLLNKDPRPKIYARKTQIVNVLKQQKSRFFDENHIQGDGPSSINIGLLYNNELVACAGFIKQKDKHYLNRYATNSQVIGGFSKLLKYFQQNYEWKQIVSFADLRWSNGNLYEKTGWKLDKILEPDYYYSKNQKRYHKFNFRRKNLPKLLSKFDPNLSEKENCDINNILRIWDCGKQRWIISC